MKHRVVIIGAGFGGLFATRALRRAPVEVTVIDRTNHHLFQPLLYQVATGVLPEGDVAPPIREVLRRQRNARVLLGEVIDLDVAAREVVLDTVNGQSRIAYDSLIVAAGAGQSYFGHDEFATDAPGLKTLDDALELRHRIFGAFEVAELEPQPQRREAWLTFAVIGAGPTGVELAGQLAELSRRALKGNYFNFDPADARIILLSTPSTRSCRLSPNPCSGARAPISSGSASRSTSGHASPASTEPGSRSRTATAPSAASRRTPRSGQPVFRHRR